MKEQFKKAWTYFREKALGPLIVLFFTGILLIVLSFVSAFKLLENRVIGMNAAIDEQLRLIGEKEAKVRESLDLIASTELEVTRQDSVLRSKLKQLDENVNNLMQAANFPEERIAHIQKVIALLSRPEFLTALETNNALSRITRLEKQSIADSLETGDNPVTVIRNVPLTPTGALCLIRINTDEHEYCTLLVLNKWRVEKVSDFHYSDGPEKRADRKPYPRPTFRVDGTERLEITGEYPAGVRIQYHFFAFTP